MFDVIEFLDQMGQDAEQRYASVEMLKTALADIRVEPALREAIIAGNQRQLEGLLGHVPFCCLISPGKPADSDEECDGNCKEGDETQEDENGKEDQDHRKGSSP